LKIANKNNSVLLNDFTRYKNIAFNAGFGPPGLEKRPDLNNRKGTYHESLFSDNDIMSHDFAKMKKKSA
jgi:hypothetical protein